MADIAGLALLWQVGSLSESAKARLLEPLSAADKHALYLATRDPGLEQYAQAARGIESGGFEVELPEAVPRAVPEPLRSAGFGKAGKGRTQELRVAILEERLEQLKAGGAVRLHSLEEQLAQAKLRTAQARERLSQEKCRTARVYREAFHAR